MRGGGRSALFLAVLASLCAVVPGAYPQTKPAADEPDIQQLFYDGLIKREVSPGVAMLLTADIEILSETDQEIRYLQRFVGGARREVSMVLSPAADGKKKRAPIQLDDGSVVQVENLGLTWSTRSYAVETNFEMPAAKLGLKESAPRDWALAWLLGISPAFAQAGGGTLATYTASFSNSQSSSSPSSSALDAMAQEVSNASQSSSSSIHDAIQAVSDALSGQNPAAKTGIDKIADGAKAGATIIKAGVNIHQAVADDAAAEAYLKYLEDCVNNPTNPLTRQAMQNDPRYRQATTDVINDARRNMKLNSAIRIVATTVNGVASAALKITRSPAAKPLSAGIGIIDKVESKMLKHVASEYIMKDVAKGVVPCDPCAPVHQPLPSAPPQNPGDPPQKELACSNPQPEQMVCEASEVNSSSSAPNFTPGPPPVPPPSPASQSCGVLKHAGFNYRFSEQRGGCISVTCQESQEARHYSGSADLKLLPENGAGEIPGYRGDGFGHFNATFHGEAWSTLGFGCSMQVNDNEYAGPVDFVVNAMFSIDNNVTGGIDTSAMSADTSVVEILLSSERIVSQLSYESCGESRQSTGEGGTNFDCHFYNVDLWRPGYYQTFKDRVPGSGICTLTLTR